MERNKKIYSRYNYKKLLKRSNDQYDNYMTTKKTKTTDITQE